MSKILSVIGTKAKISGIQTLASRFLFATDITTDWLDSGNRAKKLPILWYPKIRYRLNKISHWTL